MITSQNAIVNYKTYTIFGSVSNIIAAYGDHFINKNKNMLFSTQENKKAIPQR